MLAIAMVPCAIGLGSQPASKASQTNRRCACKTNNTSAAEGIPTSPPPVLVSGLASELCSPEVIEAILEQAGLDVGLVKYELGRRSQAGQVLLIFKDWLKAEECIAHFSGCKWGSAHAPVTARFDSKHEACTFAKKSRSGEHTLNNCGVMTSTSTLSVTSTASTASGSGRHSTKLSWAELSSDDEDVLYPTSDMRSCHSTGSRELDCSTDATDERAPLCAHGRTGDPPPVVLTGLPMRLCSDEMMNVVLDQAGIDTSFLKCELKRGFCEGEARITFNSWELAEQCIAHFSRCNWKCTYSGVSAYFDDSVELSSTPSTSDQ